jgi:hypothetical protein
MKLKTALATCAKSQEQFQHIMCLTSEAKLHVRHRTQNHKNNNPTQNKMKQAYLIFVGVGVKKQTSMTFSFNTTDI